MRVVGRSVGLLAVAASPAAGVALAQGPQSPACRELGRRFDQIATGASSVELNATLFSAADAGCVELARRLIDAGASLAARDRFGARALARAARAGHSALVELFLAQGATIDARNRAGTGTLSSCGCRKKSAALASIAAETVVSRA
jgi:hypothetical protein